MTLVSASHLRKTFGGTIAVDDVTLSVAPGEIYGLVGSDGAGKTTALRLLVGALKADAGDISICGFDVRKQTEQARAQIGYLSQRFSLYEDLTVLENIRFFAEVRGLSQKEWLPRCMEILEFVGLADFKDRRAGQLSGGMKQKLGLASALVTQPRVLLLDEPTTGVDPVTRQDFWQLVIRLVSAPLSDSPPIFGENGGSRRGVLLTTPYMDEAARCTRVGFMRKGRLISEGAPSELCATLDGCIVELRGRPLPLLRQIAAQEDGVEDVRAFGDRLHLRVVAAQAEPVIQRLRDAIPAGGGSLSEARPIPPTLEDVFIALSESKD
ncbi:MAG: ABC transporter ATP-binding protein [Chloroflexi bacterium]|nr:ABC transporter ATP-binding protein [Chloroflexota bacterium]